jgi:hypothetical protein
MLMKPSVEVIRRPNRSAPLRDVWYRVLLLETSILYPGEHSQACTSSFTLFRDYIKPCRQGLLTAYRNPPLLSKDRKSIQPQINMPLQGRNSGKRVHGPLGYADPFPSVFIHDNSIEIADTVQKRAAISGRISDVLAKE